MKDAPQLGTATSVHSSAPHRLLAGAAVLLAVIATAGCAPIEQAVTVPVPVLRVADGDTLTVRVDGKEERIRLLGIDAPEAAHDGQPAECGAKEARAELSRLVGSGPVMITSDPVSDERDRHERLLAYVATKDGADVGLALIEAGFAEAWRPASEPQPARYLGYKAAEAKARVQRSGLWSTCGSIGR